MFTHEIKRKNAYYHFVHVMRSDGSHPHSVLGDMAETEAYSPAFSPDGKRIAFEELVNNTSQIFTVRPNGTDKTRLTRCKVVGWRVAQYSPDGRRIIYWSRGRQSHYMSMAVNGSHKRKIPTHGKQLTGAPALAPSGNGMVFPGYARKSPRVGIYYQQFDGSAQSLLTKAPYGSIIDWQPIP